jgi:hypothetical protein
MTRKTANGIAFRKRPRAAQRNAPTSAVWAPPDFRRRGTACRARTQGPFGICRESSGRAGACQGKGENRPSWGRSLPPPDSTIPMDATCRARTDCQRHAPFPVIPAKAGIQSLLFRKVRFDIATYKKANSTTQSAAWRPSTPERDPSRKRLTSATSDSALRRPLRSSKDRPQSFQADRILSLPSILVRSDIETYILFSSPSPDRCCRLSHPLQPIQYVGDFVSEIPYIGRRLV